LLSSYFEQKKALYTIKHLFSFEFKLNLKCFSYIQRLKYSFLSLRSKPHFISQLTNNYLKKIQNKNYRRVRLKNKSILGIANIERIKKSLQYLPFNNAKKSIILIEKKKMKEERKILPRFIGIPLIFGPKINQMTNKYLIKFSGSRWSEKRFKTKKKIVKFVGVRFFKINKKSFFAKISSPILAMIYILYYHTFFYCKTNFLSKSYKLPFLQKKAKI